jgi:Icc protein
MTLSKTASALTIAQISDCHLFSDVNGLHHGANVYKNLLLTLHSIRNNSAIDCIVFTGDLTQDHTEGSYQNFVSAIKNELITLPVYYVAGNHDEVSLLDKYLVGSPFQASKTINFTAWQIQLLHSKSETPAGRVIEEDINRVIKASDTNKYQLLMMHHHPVDVGYFIDQHGLLNKKEFWLNIRKIPKLTAIACGHVHRAKKISPKSQLIETLIDGDTRVGLVDQYVDVYTCPATSIQFDPQANTVKALEQGPGYRLFYLTSDGQLTSETVWC